MKRRTLSLGGYVVLLAALAWSAGAMRADPGPDSGGGGRSQGKVHALFAFDTSDAIVGKSLKLDHVNVTRWFSALDRSKVAGGEPVVKVGATATSDAILQYCKQLTVGPNDAIFVYLGCHGEKQGDIAHIMRFGTRPLVRGDVVKALKGKQARLIVLITDSCYGGYEKVDTRAPVPAPGAPAAQREQVLEDLFFATSGMVNINSCAPGEFAWNGKRGGLMTSTFVDVCSRTRAEFGKTGSARVTWQDVFAAVKTRTSRAFAEFREEADPAMRGHDKLKGQKNQTVYVFEPLGNPLPAAGSGKAGKEAQIVVTLPAEAFLYFDEYLTESTGTERLYVTPPLSPDKAYHYVITAERERNGKWETVTRRISVRGGETTRITLQFPATRAP